MLTTNCIKKFIFKYGFLLIFKRPTAIKEKGELSVSNLDTPKKSSLTLSLNIRRLSKVCRFCSRSAVPAEYKFTSSSCSTATATQKRALCSGESWQRGHVSGVGDEPWNNLIEALYSIKRSMLHYQITHVFTLLEGVNI